MMDLEKLGREFWAARFTLNVVWEGIVSDDHIPEDVAEGHLEALGAAEDQIKAICDTLAKASGAFCNGYVAANRKAMEDGRKWSEERAQKIALLRLAGDNTPEEQIPL